MAPRVTRAALPTEPAPAPTPAGSSGRGQYPGAERFFPASARASLKQYREAAASCRGCDLYSNATQTVFGEGPEHAEIMLVGETPGNREDMAGHPFVGPAGGLLSRALGEAGLDRTKAYVTNAVKHFTWGARGKKRLHARPSARESGACRPWLHREIELVKPRIIVLMGAMAAQSLMGNAFRVTKERGKLITGTEWAPAIVATVHPSSILRAPDDQTRREQYAAFVADLRLVARALEQI